MFIRNKYFIRVLLTKIYSKISTYQWIFSKLNEIHRPSINITKGNQEVWRILRNSRHMQIQNIPNLSRDFWIYLWKCTKFRQHRHTFWFSIYGAGAMWLQLPHMFCSLLFLLSSTTLEFLNKISMRVGKKLYTISPQKIVAYVFIFHLCGSGVTWPLFIFSRSPSHAIVAIDFSYTKLY